jgi:hypothetical protein
VDVEQYRTELFDTLDSIFEVISKTTHLARILDSEWYKRIKDEIATASLVPHFVCDSALMFFELRHWLRGDPTFEAGQKLLFQGKIEEANDEQKRALWLFGPDPLRTLLPLLEERLAAFSALPFKQKEIQGKLKQLREHRFSVNFRNYMFEMLALGFFAVQGLLTDIEIPVGDGESTVDAAIKIDDRPIYVEVTYTSQEILPRPTQEVEVGWYSLQPMIDQVVSKTVAKVNNAKQLALINDAPTILIVGRNFLGADDIATKQAVQFCSNEFRNLSGFISSANWHFSKIEFFPSLNATVSLTEKEKQKILGLKPGLVVIP